MSVENDRGPASLLDDGPIGLRFPGLPVDASGLTLTELGAQRRPLFGGGFDFPLMVLRESAVRHNAELMAAFAEHGGVSLAPHLKTTCAPELAAYALRAGAWGVSVATPFQARVFMAAGFERILLANQVVDPGFAVEAAAWANADPRRDFLCQVDSPAGVRVLADALGARSGDRPLPVLVEIGHPGGRAGCRDRAALDAVVRAVRAEPALVLAGVSGYEGSVSHSRGHDGLAAVRDYLHWVRSAMDEVLTRPDPRRHEYVLSAGGSLYFDLVADVLAADPPSGPGAPPVRVITRPGAYLTHDQGLYAELSPLDGGGSPPEPLRPAIEVWAPVLSRPTPDLAILGAGRRDLNFDQGLPAPFEARDRFGRSARYGGPEWKIVDLNDHHAFLRLPADAELAPSDLVRLGISHPCTAHDRWRAVLLADDDDTVVSVVRCYF
ncbi:alanine racemase [Nocardiopsis mangrovi]|uniref:Alanine racemase n=1 Tax=Nocardiopsis mangrovi TaxID=1179818 RepID=A0ABV9DWK7_9ACTN